MKPTGRLTRVVATAVGLGAAVAVLARSPEWHHKPTLTVLASGDGWGEIEPCG